MFGRRKKAVKDTAAQIRTMLNAEISQLQMIQSKSVPAADYEKYMKYQNKVTALADFRDQVIDQFNLS